MGGICARLRPECVVMNPPERDREPIVRRLVETIAAVHPVGDPDLLVREVMEREELASTCIGMGCAVPHAHSAEIDTTLLAAAKLDPPAPFETPDDEPVSLVFLMVGPRNSAGLHLRLLSKLARLLHDTSFREELAASTSAEDFHQLICARDD